MEKIKIPIFPLSRGLRRMSIKKSFFFSDFIDSDRDPLADGPNFKIVLKE